MLTEIMLVLARVSASTALIISGLSLLKNKDNITIKLWGYGLIVWAASVLLSIFAFMDSDIGRGIYLIMRLTMGMTFVLLLFRGTLNLLLPIRQTNALTIIYAIIVITLDFTINILDGTQYDNIAIHSIYVGMPMGIVFFSYFYTYYLKLKDKNILFLSIAWGSFFTIELMHILSNSLRILFLERTFMILSAMSTFAIAMSFNNMRKTEESWHLVTTPKSYVVDTNFLQFMNSEFHMDTKQIIGDELNKHNVTSIYELGPKEIENFIEKLLNNNFGQISPERKSNIKTRIIELLGLRLPSIQDLSEDDEKEYHVSSINEFYDNFDKIGQDKKTIIGALSKLDFNTYDKNKLRDFLSHNGLSVQETESILQSLLEMDKKNKNIESLVQEIKTKKSNGIEDDALREEFKGRGLDKDNIERAFKRYYKHSIYKNYIPNIVEHMKNFVLMRRRDDDILDIFLQHGWPREPLEDALKMAKFEIEKDKSSIYIEEEVLKTLLKTDSKDRNIKVLLTKNWPEDELKKRYLNIDEAMANFESCIERLEFNEASKEAIRKSLIGKSWPSEIVNKAVEDLADKISYHKEIYNLKKKIYDMIYKGYFVNPEIHSRMLTEHLIREGWEEYIVTRTINRITEELVAKGEKDKLREFTSHIFKNRKSSKNRDINKVLSGFDTIEATDKISQIAKKEDEKSSLDLNIPNVEEKKENKEDNEKERHNFDDLKRLLGE